MNLHGKTDIGATRETNQDTFAFGQPTKDGCFALVCDGMGGENGGNIASSLARDTVVTMLTRGMRENMDSNSIRNLILTALTAANSIVFERAQSDPELSGMGTTAVLAVVVQDTIHLGHVGDSRAYLVSDEGLTKLTRDHSVVQMLLEQGKITQEQAQVHPQKNQITRAVGVDEDVQVDYNEFEFHKKAKLLLCTDGLTNWCDEDKICKIVRGSAAKQACGKLVNQANKSGGYDNITAVIVEN